MDSALPAQPGSQARLPACGPAAGLDGQRPSSQGQQWAADQPARDKGLSEQPAGACVPGWGREQPGRSQEWAVGLVTCGILGGVVAGWI